jgi:hypothetical protein
MKGERLTIAHRDYLAKVAQRSRYYEIGNSTLHALVRRGLLIAGPLVGTKRLYAISEAGRAALSPSSLEQDAPAQEGK